MIDVFEGPSRVETTLTGIPAKRCERRRGMSKTVKFYPLDSCLLDERVELSLGDVVDLNRLYPFPAMLPLVAIVRLARAFFRATTKQSAAMAQDPPVTAMNK